MRDMRAWVAGAFGLVFGLFACSGGGTQVQAGPMPAGGEFTGVYHSPQYGEMHMIQNGDSVRGEYKQDERTGRINGTVDGNLMRFEWVEMKAMVANRPQETRGHGYFVYKVDPANGEHVIVGRWGLDDDDSQGGDWNAYKMKNREPQLSEESSGGESGGDYYDEGLDSEGDDEGDTGGDDFSGDEGGDDIF